MVNNNSLINKQINIEIDSKMNFLLRIILPFFYLFFYLLNIYIFIKKKNKIKELKFLIFKIYLDIMVHFGMLHFSMWRSYCERHNVNIFLIQYINK